MYEEAINKLFLGVVACLGRSGVVFVPFSSPPNHLTIKINTVLQSLRHCINLSIYKPLRDLLPSLNSQFSRFKLIPVRETNHELLG